MKLEEFLAEGHLLVAGSLSTFSSNSLFAFGSGLNHFAFFYSFLFHMFSFQEILEIRIQPFAGITKSCAFSLGISAHIH